MKVKLIKDHQEYMLINDERFVIATTDESMLEVTDKMKLSKQNCDEIFGVVDVEKLAMGYDLYEKINFVGQTRAYIAGFNKAMELNKDKLFTIDDIDKAIEWATVNGRKGDITHYDIDNFIQSTQQPTEIEVEIEMECLDPNCDGINKKGVCIPGDKPKLDSEGCLILTKKI